MPENTQRPVCYIIAGPNGAGKTTFAFRYLPVIAACNNFINVDEIAKGISPLNFSSALVLAGKLFLAQLENKIAEGRDFAFETTLSGKSYMPKIDKWRAAGWRVVLFYLYIPNCEFSADRVKQRVSQGGHDIPMRDIVRRYPRSVKNLFEYAEHCDRTVCFNNSELKIRPVFEKDLGRPLTVYDQSVFSKIMEICHGNER